MEQKIRNHRQNKKENPERPASTTKSKKSPNHANREFAVVTYTFLAAFLCLMGYFTYFQFVQSEPFINNPYNKRQELFTQKGRFTLRTG